MYFRKPQKLYLHAQKTHSFVAKRKLGNKRLLLSLSLSLSLSHTHTHTHIFRPILVCWTFLSVPKMWEKVPIISPWLKHPDFPGSSEQNLVFCNGAFKRQGPFYVSKTIFERSISCIFRLPIYSKVSNGVYAILKTRIKSTPRYLSRTFYNIASCDN